MPAAAVSNPPWQTGTWPDTAWEEGTWGLTVAPEPEPPPAYPDITYGVDVLVECASVAVGVLCEPVLGVDVLIERVGISDLQVSERASIAVDVVIEPASSVSDLQVT